MSVFDRGSKVRRAVSDPRTDKTLPSSGALSWGGITSDAGLSSTTGAEASLIHGDEWAQLVGARTHNVGKTFDTTVTGKQTVTVLDNQTIKVGGDQSETICGKSTETLIGPHQVTNVSVFNETRIGAHTTVHGELEMVNDEDGKIHYGLRQYTFYAMTHEIEGVHFEFAPEHFEIKGNHFYLSGLDANAVIIKLEVDPINVEASATEASVKLLTGRVQAMEGKLGAMEAKAVAAIPTAGADVNPTPLI